MRIVLTDADASQRPGAERFKRRWADLIERPAPRIVLESAPGRERPGAERFRRRWGASTGSV